MMIFRYLSDCYNSTYNYFFNINHEPFNKIPDELLLHIFSFLNPSQLANCQLACKKWKVISDDELLWKHQNEVPKAEAALQSERERQGARIGSCSIPG